MGVIELKSRIKSNTIPISEARAELPEIIGRVQKFHNHYFITRRGKVAAVIMSAEELESWGETLDILSNKAEMRALRRAEKQVSAGKVKSLEDVFRELK